MLTSYDIKLSHVTAFKNRYKEQRGHVSRAAGQIKFNVRHTLLMAQESCCTEGQTVLSAGTFGGCLDKLWSMLSETELNFRLTHAEIAR